MRPEIASLISFSFVSTALPTFVRARLDLALDSFRGLPNFSRSSSISKIEMRLSIPLAATMFENWPEATIQYSSNSSLVPATLTCLS
jgi:hypothetical protein